MDRTERAALYVRVSTEEQKRRGLSLPEQEKVLEEYAKAHKMKVVDVYRDGGKSARKRYTSRPEFMRLLEDVKAGKIDTIIFIKLDRWFRDISQYYEVQNILDAHNVTWRATQEDYETVTASGRFKVNIMLSVAQDEADRTSERIKFVFEGKRERNEPTAGRVPKGYKLEGKAVVLNPETAPLVREAFEMYLDTGAPSKVIQAFPSLNLNYRVLREMILSDAYTGDFNGIKIPPIITPEEHDRLLAMRKQYARKTKQNRTYLFSGLLFCPECGGRLRGKAQKRKDGGSYQYYVCRRNENKSGCGFGHHVREDKVEQYLLNNLEAKVTYYAEGEKVRRNKSYKAQRDAIKRKLSKLSELYVNELITMPDYKRQYEDLTAQLAAVPPDEKVVDIDRLRGEFSGNWRELYENLPREKKAVFWRKTIKSVTFDGREVANFDLV